MKLGVENQTKFVALELLPILLPAPWIIVANLLWLIGAKVCLLSTGHPYRTVIWKMKQTTQRTAQLLVELLRQLHKELLIETTHQTTHTLYSNYTNI